MKKYTLVATLAIGTALVAALTGCTDSSDDDATAPTPEPTSSSAADPAQQEQLDPTGACVEGHAIIAAIDGEFTLSEPCENVSIVGHGSTIELTGVAHLALEDADNTVTVTGGLETIVAIAGGNTVTYDGPAAEIDDQAEGNTFTTR